SRAAEAVNRTRSGAIQQDQTPFLGVGPELKSLTRQQNRGKCDESGVWYRVFIVRTLAPYMESAAVGPDSSHSEIATRAQTVRYLTMDATGSIQFMPGAFEAIPGGTKDGVVSTAYG